MGGLRLKIPVAEPEIGAEELQNVMAAVKSGWVSSKGPFIEEFERGFSRFLDVKHGIATSNGTTALHLAVAALGIGKGDKVLVPSLTFIATANAVAYTGATPVFVDSHPQYWCIDPSEVEANIDHHTKAIIVVHLYGHPCDMDPITAIAETHNLHVIEDCAEAHGAEYKHRKVGSFGIINCFSFYGNKIITTGEGGMCLTNNDALAHTMRVLRDHGMNPDKKYWHDVVGFNYRMTNLQAALGVAQLSKINALIAKKRHIASLYNHLLADIPGITPAPEMPWAKNVYWLYSVLVKKGQRDHVLRYLERHGIESRPFFYPQHILPPYQNGGSFPIAEELAARGLNLPSGPRLSDADISDVSKVMSEACDG